MQLCKITHSIGVPHLQVFQLLRSRSCREPGNCLCSVVGVADGALQIQSKCELVEERLRQLPNTASFFNGYNKVT